MDFTTTAPIRAEVGLVAPQNDVEDSSGGPVWLAPTLICVGGIAFVTMGAIGLVLLLRKKSRTLKKPRTFELSPSTDQEVGEDRMEFNQEEESETVDTQPLDQTPTPQSTEESISTERRETVAPMGNTATTQATKQSELQRTKMTREGQISETSEDPERSPKVAPEPRSQVQRFWKELEKFWDNKKSNSKETFDLESPSKVLETVNPLTLRYNPRVQPTSYTATMSQETTEGGTTLSQSTYKGASFSQSVSATTNKGEKTSVSATTTNGEKTSSPSQSVSATTASKPPSPKSKKMDTSEIQSVEHSTHMNSAKML